MGLAGAGRVIEATSPEDAAGDASTGERRGAAGEVDEKSSEESSAARARTRAHTRAAGSSKNVVILAGGTGGAKLARGMLDVVGPERVTVIANTADDIEIYGAHVSPDPDLISFWLADLIDERGWGLRGDTFHVMDALRDLGLDVWFNLGDRDLAWCVERTRLVAEGLSATAALARLDRAIGVRASVLPMCEGRLRTHVNGRHIQEFLIREGGQGPVLDVSFEVGVGGGATMKGGATMRGGATMKGRATARGGATMKGRATARGEATAWRGASARGDVGPTPEVLAALAGAEVVIVGPSNPVISIWPILLALGDALGEVAVPVVCVSPIVGGAVLKGPTAAFLDAMGQPTSASGVVAFYESIAPGLLDGVVADEAVPAGLAALQIDTTLSDPAARARVAGRVLDFARSLR